MTRDEQRARERMSAAGAELAAALDNLRRVTGRHLFLASMDERLEVLEHHAPGADLCGLEAPGTVYMTPEPIVTIEGGGW